MLRIPCLHLKKPFRSLGERFRRASRRSRLLIVAALLAFATGAVFSAIVAVQAHFNQELFANQAAETLRSVFGERIVNKIEHVVYNQRHRIRRFFYHRRGRENPAVAARLALPLADEPLPPASADIPANIEPLLESPKEKGEGQWTPLKARSQGLWITQVRPNAEEAWEHVKLVAIDLYKLKLVFVPGTEVTRQDELSRVPPEDWPSLVAVFNGGFRGHHRATGMRKNGMEYKLLRSGLASVILDSSQVLICRWNSDVEAEHPSADVRQNLTPLIEDGKCPGGLLRNENLDFPTYRTGLGITADHRWLIFAGGDGLEPYELAAALRMASCRTAIHLDQNPGNVCFEIAKEAKPYPQLAPIELPLHLTTNRKFFAGSKRDFFYLVRRLDEK